MCMVMYVVVVVVFVLVVIKFFVWNVLGFVVLLGFLFDSFMDFVVFILNLFVVC